MKAFLSPAKAAFSGPLKTCEAQIRSSFREERHLKLELKKKVRKLFKKGFNSFQDRLIDGQFAFNWLNLNRIPSSSVTCV
jgi:hypothetical protein